MQETASYRHKCLVSATLPSCLCSTWLGFVDFPMLVVHGQIFVREGRSKKNPKQSKTCKMTDVAGFANRTLCTALPSFCYENCPRCFIMEAD